MSRPASVVLHASSVALAARAWVADSHSARLLHVFHRSCNFINEHGRILSLVAGDIGDGPFNAVVPGLEQVLRGAVDVSSRVEVCRGSLWLDGLALNLRSASLWHPRPDWRSLHESRAWIRLCVCPFGDMAPVDGPMQEAAAGSRLWQQRTGKAILCASGDLSTAINRLDGPAVSSAASRLAGLGEGLTPAGDDVLMGAIHAAWIIHDADQASALGSSIVDAARHHTTALSLAWLEAAARGDAAARWHRFLSALLFGDASEIEVSVASILATGHTSGRAALYGFVTTLLHSPF